eukprot:4740791-Amphidinium_carterae.1
MRCLWVRKSKRTTDRWSQGWRIWRQIDVTSNMFAKSWQDTCRLGRYLLGRPRVAQRFVQQKMPTRLRVMSDLDHGGCLVSIRSTSSTYMFHGQHLLHASSATQTVVALSSAEVEFYAAVKSTSYGPGAIGMFSDIGITYKELRLVQMDATAGIAVVSAQNTYRVHSLIGI